MIEKINQIARSADVSAERADGLGQGSDLNIHAPVHFEMIDGAAAVAAEHAGGVRIVDWRNAPVSRVYYPGLPAHPGHEIAAKQMRGFGGMVSFAAAGGPDEAVAICGRTRLFTLAESLGGVESLIEHPARMTHSSVAGSALEVPADLIRLSVGLESCDDLLEDLRAALSPR